MDSESSAAPMPSSERRIVAAESETEAERAHVMLNSPSTMSPSSAALAPSPSGDNGGQESTNAPSPGERKGRLSFKEKQRKSISHLGGGNAIAKPTLMGDLGSGFLHSPTSTASSSSPQQRGISPVDSQTLQAARKAATTDAAAGPSTTITTNTGAKHLMTRCVFTALEPTRAGPRSAARPPSRNQASHASRPASSTTLSVSPATSTEASPMQKPQSSSENTCASLSLMRSSFAALPTLQVNVTTMSNTSSSVSPLIAASACAISTASEGRDALCSTLAGGLAASPAGSAADGQSYVEVLQHPSDSPASVVSAPSASSIKMSFSSSSLSSRRLSFKDRQRAGAAAAANIRNPPTRGLMLSPVMQVSPTTAEGLPSTAVPPEVSKCFPMRSPNGGLAVAGPTASPEKPLLRGSPTPATSAIVAPAQRHHHHVDPIMEVPRAANGGDHGDSPSKEGRPPTIGVPRLPLDRIRTGESPRPSYPTSPQSTQREGSERAGTAGSTSQLAAAASISPLTLPTAPAGPAAPSFLAAGPSSSATQCPHAAPATSTERHSGGAPTSYQQQPTHARPLTGSPSQSAKGMADGTTVEGVRIRGGPTNAGSGEAEDADDKTGILSFTQNLQRLHLYDLEGATPRELTTALPPARGTAEGRSTRPGAMMETPANSTRWSASRHQRARAGWEFEGDPMHPSGSASSGVRSTHGGGGSGGDRRAFAARRARTGSLGSPLSNDVTFPPSPSLSIPISTSPSSRSPRKVPTSELAKLTGQGGRSTNAVIGHWRQHNQSPQQYQWQSFSNTVGSVASSIDTSELSAALSESQLGGAGRARARRHRGKMLAPDGTVLNTPRTGRGPGGERGGSTPANNVDPRIHVRSRTADCFSLCTADAGRAGVLTPSTAALSSVVPTLTPTVTTLALPGTGYAVVAAKQDGGASAGVAPGEGAGPLYADGKLSRPLTALFPLATDTAATANVGSVADAGGGDGHAADPSGSSQSRGLVSFPRLPPLHLRTSSSGSSGGRATIPVVTVPLSSGPSAETISVVTPATVATPNGYRSNDEHSSNDASCCNQTEVYTYGSMEEPGQASLPDDQVNGDGDCLLQTYNSYYGLETLSATTAELRKSRRRSNYSSLHYGTMTGYRHRGDSRRPRSGSAVLRGRRQGGTHDRRAGAEGGENEERAALSAKLSAQAALDARSSAALHQSTQYSNNDDEESICEQKGSEEDRAKEAADVEAAARSEGGATDPNRLSPHGQHHYQNLHRHALADEEEDDTEGGQRRTVGIWETIEHVFLPKYELVSEAASKEPLMGLASPNSPHQSGTGSTGRPGLTTEDSSPLVTVLKGSSPSPNALSSHGLQPIPTVLLSSLSAQPKLPYSAETAPPAVTPLHSVEQSPSVGPSGASGAPRLSGLVVLPDALNLSDDPSSSASLTFSQFRKSSGKVAGTKRLQPENFTFGTVAATYNMEPTDELKLPDGAADAKVAARLIFDASAGVLLMDPEDEGGRFEQHGHASLDAHSSSSSPKKHNEESEEEAGGEDGACKCEADFIAKDFKGLDCGRYDANDLYDHCSRCHRRPAAFLCLHCMEAVCPSHVQRHHLLNPTQCTLFLNLLDIMSSFDRIFWCEKCKQFTWKHTEIYDALVDQIAYTRGTYLKHPARDIHCMGYEVRLKDATSQGAAAAATIARSEPSVSEDVASGYRDSSLRPHGAAGGSSHRASLQNASASPALATFPKLCGGSQVAHALPMRSSTPPMNAASSANRLAVRPSMLGVNNLIVCSALPSSPVGSNGAASLFASNAVGTPSLRPLKSPMQHFLSRDPLEASGARAVTVGEPVTKLCALGASVQGWRTTQEDAEAAFLVDIPALSNEMVDQKELRAVAAAAAEREKQQQHQDNVHGGGPEGSEPYRKKNVSEKDVCGGADSADETMPRSHGNSRPGTSVAVHDVHELESSVSSYLPVLDGTLRASDLENMSGVKEGEDEEGGCQRYPLRSASQRAIHDGDEGREHKSKETIPMAVFCVFDGHGGDAVAKLAARHFETHLRRAIDGIRADDVRARALLFYLNAESNAASVLGPQPAVTAVPGADGSITFLPANSPAAFAATQRATSVSAQSPPALFSCPHNLSTSPHSGTTMQSSSCHSKLLVPGNTLLVPYGTEESEPLQPQSVAVLLQDGVEDNDVLQNMCLPDAIYSESIPVVMPVTAESLRMHVAGSALSFPGACAGGVGEESPRKAPPSNSGVDSTGCNAHRLLRNRRSRTTLDAWADMEDSQREVGPSIAAAAVASASPPTQRLLPPSVAAVCSSEFRHFSTANSCPQNLMAASTTYCSPPSAWVSIPEMEMLRQYFASIMEDALLSLDDYLRSTPEGMRGDYDCVGCTACVVGITANFVLCANVGDSGAAFYTKDRIKVISVKHRVSDEEEQKRINAAGYSILNDRIEGMSAVPRALGDFDFKQCGGRGPREQAVSAVPDVTIMPTPSDTDQWGIILACDGVWDTATLHQVHVALTNTVNDLDVASSATEAVLRGAELYRHHLRGPGAPRADSPSASQRRSSSSLEGSGEKRRKSSHDAASRSREGSASPSPAKRRALSKGEDGEGSVIGDYESDECFMARRLPQLDPILLTAAAGVFAQCVAPADNDEGVGLDNCSLIIVERRNVQE
ncbi:hypothetical protein ABL78_7271 [Leptomonas seymouri]|uniref:PPM-type phosphatase domain-containing protein n=1 Tax=Leptomonas seymouri TaxID=5684 RepID=A0A0N0P341_LEPSE|nr:hypothetical protein ABL78_7271 [Leptomonas seymouri]|eukprot:KPI83689.1 hypothetical protein ABL78_7271 [Leptomonas seymouri]